MSDEAVVGIARVLTHRLCVRLIDELVPGEATVSDLAARLGEPQPSISSHLALLRGARLVDSQVQGRQRVYRLRGTAPATALSTLRSLADALDAGPRQVRRPTRGAPAGAPLRRARTCYDHLAGEAGVELLDRLLAQGWLGEAGEREYRLTGTGAAELAANGVDVDAARRARRRFALACLDWTERRPHLGGALGAEVLSALVSSGHVRLEPGTRAVRIDRLPWPT